MRDNGRCEVIELLSDDDETPAKNPPKNAQEAVSYTEVVVLDSTDPRLPSKAKEALFDDDFRISICNKPSEVRVFDVKPSSSASSIPYRSRKRPRSARKSLSSFTPKFGELINVSSDEDINTKKAAEVQDDDPPQLSDALEQFLNQVFIALQPNTDAIKEIEKRLNSALNNLSISLKKTEVLHSYFLQLTMNLSLDSKKVYDYVEEGVAKLNSFDEAKKQNGRKSSNSSEDDTSSAKRLKLDSNRENESSPPPSCHDKDPDTRVKIIPNKGKKVPIANELEDEDCFVNDSSAISNKKDNASSKASNSQANAHIKKLKDALDVCGKEIQRLELAEVDTNDDDSSYVVMCKYKRRFMKIYNKIIELEGDLPKWKSQVVSLQTLGSHQIKKFKDTISRHPEINTEISNFINKGIKKSLNSTYFPDFQDIMQIFVEVNKSSKLGMHKEEIYHEASDAFQLIGRKLQSRRVNDVHASMDSYLKEDESEPVLSDEVKKKLKENQVIAEKSLDKVRQVIQDFTLRQTRGNCEPHNDPPEEDEDDETISSLEDDSDDESGDSEGEEDLSSSESEESDNDS